MNMEFYIVLASMAASFILAVLIIIHLRKSLLGYFLFWINFGLAGWVVSNYVSNMNLSYIQSLWWNRAIFSTTAIASWGFALFSEVFPTEQRINKVEKWLMFSALIFVVLLSLSSFLVQNIVQGEFVTDVTFGWGIYFYGAFVVGCLFYTVWRILRKYFTKKYAEYKNVLSLLVIGVSVFLVFAIITNLILPLFFNQFTFTILTPVYTSSFSFIVFWAILKHKFLNIKVIATEMFTFSLWAFLLIHYLFANDLTEKISDASLLLLVLIFGIFLIRAVEKESERKDELQTMANKLAVANDELRKLDNAKTEFISIASHQLRTPITAIKGFSSLLLEGSYGEVSESVRGALDKIYISSERLVNLIEELLNVSRIESGRLQYDFALENVEKIINELYDNFILIAKNKKFYLDIKFSKVKLPAVMMDGSKIRELISNFIDNALKYTEAGGVTIRTELKDDGACIDEKGFVISNKKSEFGKVVRITVSDTGIGIPKEEIPYLFKKFSRGKDVSRLHVGGTGLGLYVGKAIAEAHHGQVWVESDGAGKGSRFIIEIPVEHVA